MTGRVLVGVGWAAVTFIALLAGSVTLAVWLAANAAVAAAELVHGRGQLFAVVGASVMVLGAGFGVIGAALGFAVALVAALGWGDRRLVGLAPAIAVIGPVLLRATNGLVPALVLLVYAAVYDAAAFVMGTDARWRWEGPLAGMACIGTVTVAVAAIFPQFKGQTPWELGVLAAVVAPVGPFVVDRLLGRGRDQARVPAVRRLDSLVVLGPAWAIAAAVLVK